VKYQVGSGFKVSFSSGWMKNLYLIGYRGAGKSEVARILAGLLEREHFCVDREIQAEQNRSIAGIFTDFGEARFRQLEQEKVRQASERSGLIVDLGGGAVLDAENRHRIASGICVWLKAKPETLDSRIRADQQSATSRPALTDQPGLAEVRAVLAERESLYAECADYEIDTDRLSPFEVGQQIVSWLATVDTE
jgi:shikimate kinase